MSSHIFSLITRATFAISKQAKVMVMVLDAGDPRYDERYAQATKDASDILTHLYAYVEALEACVNQVHVATIEAEVSARHPIKTLAQILET